MKEFYEEDRKLSREQKGREKFFLLKFAVRSKYCQQIEKGYSVDVRFFFHCEEKL